MEEAPADAGNSPKPATIDPIVRALHEAHRTRRIFPAGHAFSMTNPIVNGHMVTMGTCSCGETFSYRWGSYERMDAAIEAHWQKFDHLPDKVDGRGNPIGEAKPAKQSRKTKSSEAGGTSQPQNSAPVVSPPAGAEIDFDDPFIKACVQLAWKDDA